MADRPIILAERLALTVPETAGLVVPRILIPTLGRCMGGSIETVWFEGSPSPNVPPLLQVPT